MPAGIKHPVTPAERAAIQQIDLAPTEDETKLAEVYRLLTRGYTDALIVRIARGELGIGGHATRTLITRVRESLKVDAEARKPYARAEQIARLRDLIEKLNLPKFKMQMVKEIGPNGKAVQVLRRVEQPLPAQAIMRAEEQLARVEGNEAPIKVEVEAKLSVTARVVFANLTPERFQGLLERARERKRLAAASQVVEVPGE